MSIVWRHPTWRKRKNLAAQRSIDFGKAFRVVRLTLGFALPSLTLENNFDLQSGPPRVYYHFQD